MSRILLIVGGGIAAYKTAELIRMLRKQGHSVTPVLTEGGSHFVTPMSLAALAESPVYSSLWDLKDEAEMEAIAKALEQTNWNRKKAAALLQISYKALLYKIRQYDLQRMPSSTAP